MPPPAFRSIAIVGAGAVGMYYGCKLGRAGARVWFLMRSDLAAVQARGSVVVHEPSGTSELHPVAAVGSTTEIGNVDLVIVSLKTTVNAELPRLLPPLLGRETAILTVQNGLGSDELLAGLFGGERVLGGLAFMATTRTGPGEVKCYHPGHLTVGEFDRPPEARTRALEAQWSAAGMRMRIADNLLEARWRKLVWNVPFNGLGVAHNVTTDVLCATPELAAEIRALMREVQQAAAAFGFAIPDRFLDQQFAATPGMGPYQPSSLVDYRAGREVEVEAIWGEPVRRAEAKGVAVPRLRALYERLKSLAPADQR